jgi:hypothetical protein
MVIRAVHCRAYHDGISQKWLQKNACNCPSWDRSSLSGVSVRRFQVLICGVYCVSFVFACMRADISSSVNKEEHLISVCVERRAKAMVGGV